MGQTSITKTYNDLLSSTLNSTRGVVYDQISRDNVCFAILHAADKKVTEKGGEKIERIVRRKLNETVGSYEGAEELDLTPQEGNTVCQYNWRKCAGSVTITGIEEAKNRGKSRIISLLTDKIDNLAASFADEMNRQMWALTRASKDFNSIPTIIAGAAGTTLGSIDASVETYWENQRTASTSDTADITEKAFLQELYRVRNNCSKGPGGGPDYAIADQTTYELYVAILDTRVRYAQTKVADMGFDVVKLRNSNLVWDERVPDPKNSELSEADGGSPTHGAVYYLNTRYLDLTVMEGADMVNRPFMPAQNQDAKSSLVLIYGNVTSTARRKQGLLHSIEYTSILSDAEYAAAAA